MLSYEIRKLTCLVCELRLEGLIAISMTYTESRPRSVISSWPENDDVNLGPKDSSHDTCSGQENIHADCYKSVTNFQSKVYGNKCNPNNTSGVHNKTNVFCFVKASRNFPRAECKNSTDNDKENVT